jgi:hypothetical protein
MRRPTVAYLASADTLPTNMAGKPIDGKHAARRDDGWEHDVMIGAIGMGLHYAGRSIVPVQWDADLDWSQFEAAVVGTTWDYTRRAEEFIAALQRIACATRVLNEPAVIAWNCDKRYLLDIALTGVAIIPTLWLAAATEQACLAAFDQFGTDDLVIKPQVGAGAWRQARLGRGAPFPHADKLPPGPAMLQPFMPSIATQGEFSLLFFDGEFSHAVVKRAAANDYRIQSEFGGVDAPCMPPEAFVQAAKLALRAVPNATRLLYARVDMIAGLAGQPLVMELELIEPYLYPMAAPQMGTMYAAAYQRLLS